MWEFDPNQRGKGISLAPAIPISPGRAAVGQVKLQQDQKQVDLTVLLLDDDSKQIKLQMIFA